MIEQAMLHMREEAMDAGVAIIEATRNRIRPIFMSTLTSLFGLVPLVIFPGAGSELYRGLGVVVFGGLGLSTIATLIIVPPLLSIALQSRLPPPPVHRQSLTLRQQAKGLKHLVGGQYFSRASANRLQPCGINVQPQYAAFELAGKMQWRFR